MLGLALMVRLAVNGRIKYESQLAKKSSWQHLGWVRPRPSGAHKHWADWDGRTGGQFFTAQRLTTHSVKHG
jgi:hypothetical protein